MISVFDKLYNYGLQMLKTKEKIKLIHLRSIDYLYLHNKLVKSEGNCVIVSKSIHKYQNMNLIKTKTRYFKCLIEIYLKVGEENLDRIRWSVL